MKILEVRDGFIKIESEKRIEISSFLEIKGLEKKYVAQVIRSKNNGTGFNIYAKILFIYDGMLKKYDKTMPDNSAEILEFKFETVNNSFNYAKPVVAGKFITEDKNILVDSENFNRSTIVSIDNQEMNDIVVQNLAKQYKQLGKTIIIDMLGSLSGDSFVAGRDFKLPLNTGSLKFMYEDCLNDATADSKNMIKDIFADLVEYSKSVKFLPFATLKTIIDDMVEKSHIFKLLVLKNKLTKFDAAGYFASNPTDAENLTNILKSNFAIIDLSKVDGLFQNRYLSVILSELEEISTQTSILIEVSNAIDKRNIKKLLYSEYINTIFVTHSGFKYLADLKPLFKNYVIENTYANKNIFSMYSFFLDSMDSTEYLIVGDSTNFVPLISKVEKYDVKIQKLPQDSTSEEVIGTSYDSQVTEETSADEYELGEIKTGKNVELEGRELPEVQSEDIISNDLDESEISDNEEISANIFDDNETTSETSEGEIISEEEVLTEGEEHNEADDELIESVETPTTEESELDETKELETEPIQEEDVEIPHDLADDFEEIEQSVVNDKEDNKENLSDEFEDSRETQVLPLENQDSDLGEITELDDSSAEDISDDDILVDLNDDEDILVENIQTQDDSVSNTDRDIDQDIIEDVDKVFTTMKDDIISDNDLDFIDALNESGSINADVSEDAIFNQNDNEVLEQFVEEDDEQIAEPLEEISDSHQEETQEKEILEKRETTTPIVPIYDAEIPTEDRVVSDDIEQGDTVFHAKYGSGVVEKMIKYGNKNLYSINFDNVGRRLLDPTLTEIKKA